MTLDRFQNIGVADLYRGLDLEKGLFLNFLARPDQRYRPRNIRRLGYKPINDKTTVALSRAKYNKAVMETTQSALIHPDNDGKFAISPGGILYLRRN